MPYQIYALLSAKIMVMIVIFHHRLHIGTRDTLFTAQKHQRQVFPYEFM